MNDKANPTRTQVYLRQSLKKKTQNNCGVAPVVLNEKGDNAMKTILKHFGVLAVLLSAMAAHAQYQDQAKVNVPFAFNAAGRTLPAGEYRVKFDERAKLVTLTGEEGTVALLSSYADAQSDPRTFLQFK